MATISRESKTDLYTEIFDKAYDKAYSKYFTEGYAVLKESADEDAAFIQTAKLAELYAKNFAEGYVEGYFEEIVSRMGQHGDKVSYIAEISGASEELVLLILEKKGIAPIFESLKESVICNECR